MHIDESIFPLKLYVTIPYLPIPQFDTHRPMSGSIYPSLHPVHFLKTTELELSNSNSQRMCSGYYCDPLQSINH